MPFYLGIDAGGTHTECAVADHQRILARATAGTSKIHKVGRGQANDNLLAAVQGALKQGGVQGREVVASCVGIAGSSDPEVRRWVNDTLAGHVHGQVTVVGDNEIAHRAAFKGGPGVLVVSGTGSIAHGRNEQGESVRVGGWGPIISDEGSGTWIGREAVRRIMRAFDDGRTTVLTRKIFEAWNLKDHDDLVREGNRSPGPEFSLLFPAVVEAAREGDSIAADVLGRAGVELAILSAAVMAKLWQDSATVPLCGIGGVITNSTIVRQVLGSTIRELRPGAHYDDRKVDPIEGAVAMARLQAP